MFHTFIQRGKICKRKHLFPVFGSYHVMAEICQSLSGIAGHTDMRIHTIYR